MWGIMEQQQAVLEPRGSYWCPVDRTDVPRTILVSQAPCWRPVDHTAAQWTTDPVGAPWSIWCPMSHAGANGLYWCLTVRVGALGTALEPIRLHWYPTDHASAHGLI